MTEEDILKLTKNPLVLLFVMFLGGLCSIGKQIRDAKRNGNTDVTFMTYIQHWPELLMAAGILVAAFVGMVESHTLNFASAWSTGYASNSLADLVRKDGRSAAMAPPKKEE